MEINSFIRGGIYLAKLNSSKYDEIGKLRPVVILTSQKLLDSKHSFIFICPLSSQSQEAYKHLHFKISSRDKLKKSSYVPIEHFKSISLQRLHNTCLSVLTNKELEQITNTLFFMIN